MLIPSFLVISVVCMTANASLRGVHPDKLKSYQSEQFQCADGKQTFPISFVNDDYCDCLDGSDEPGTSACPNGSFYCANVHFKGQLITSSRVDDGICDCCDGSDEVAGKCPNNCKELGAHLQEEAKRIRKEQAIGSRHHIVKHEIGFSQPPPYTRTLVTQSPFLGYQQRLVYATDGKAAKEKRDEEIKIFESEIEQLRVEMEEREEHKSAAKGPADEAKEAARVEHEAAALQREMTLEEEVRDEAEREYSLIDADSSGDVTLDELKQYASMGESVISEEEVQDLAESGEVEASAVIDLIRNKLRDMRQEEERKRGGSEEEREEEDEEKRRREEEEEREDVEENGEGEELWGEDGKRIERDDYDEYDDVEEDFDDFDEDKQDRDTDSAGLVYDTETQRLIDVYEEAEKLYNEAKSRHDNVKRQLDDLRKLDEIDFGTDQEFYSLKGQCFTIRDKYVYKLCPFDKCDQAGTLIGRWGHWETSHDGVNHYNRMKFTNGNSCWQGPVRSTTVQVVCGPDNKLVSASEPAKCEYEYVFATPAACTKVQDEAEIHDEL